MSALNDFKAIRCLTERVILYKAWGSLQIGVEQFGSYYGVTSQKPDWQSLILKFGSPKMTLKRCIELVEIKTRVKMSASEPEELFKKST